VPKTISFAGLSASGADGPPAGALPSGIGVGRYEIARLLRHDAYALTYAATDAQDGSDVVIREYLPLQLAARDGARTVLPRSAEAADHFHWGRERFVSEARRLASLARTPGIVRVRGIVEAHGTVAMVMDPVPGETLEARLAREGRLPPAVVEQMLEVLLAGLSRAHANAVLHLDITPHAIVLDEADRPTLIDFSRARLALAARLKSRLLRPGSAYAAPELSGDTRPAPQSDIYGLSATLYHCVAGRPPPAAAARRTMVPAAQAAAGHYTPALLAGIDAGLALKVEDRPPTVGAWRLRLMGDEELPEEKEEEDAAPPSPAHRPFAAAAAQLGSARARLDATASSAASKARESRERLRRHTAARAASATSRFRRGRARLAALPAACSAGLRRAAGALASPAIMRTGREHIVRHRRWLPLAALVLVVIAGAATAAWHALRPGGVAPADTIATAPPPPPGDETARREAEAKRIAQQQEEAARREAEEKAAAEEAARREAEAKRAAEQEAARREAEAKRAAEQEAARREAEAKRAAEQEAARREAEEKARAEAARQQREAEAKRAQEEAARRAAEEKARAAATVQRRHEAEARARAAALRAQEAATHAKEAQVQSEAAARQQREAEAKRAQEETARHEAEEKARAEAARQQREAEAKRAQAEATRRQAEEKARAEAARQQREAEAKRAQEEAARRAAEEKARAEAARQQREAEAKHAQEEAARRAAEEKRAREEAARREAEAREKAQAQRFAEILDRLESEAAIPEPPATKPSAPTDPRQAEAAERALGLSPRDRARVQIALSSLGFDTKGVDEVFGPRTRQMIAAWQKKQGAPDTGFLTRQQFATLERTAEEALGRYDAEQRRFEEMMRDAAPPQARRERGTPAKPARWTPGNR
jgi:hypothetical protein